jgi:hypothetical protein
MNNDKNIQALFINDTGAIIDSGFEQSTDSVNLRDNAPWQDWYESRGGAVGGDSTLLTLDQANIAGNSGKKAKMLGNIYGNAYMTQEFTQPLTGTFSVQWDVYVDEIINSTMYADRAAIILIGDYNPADLNGPNSGSARNFVWLAFYKDGDGTTGEMNLVAINTTGQALNVTTLYLKQWYTIKVMGNLNTDTYDIYVDGVLSESNIPARTLKDNVTHISFAQWNDGAGTFYIDNVYSPTPG